MFELDQIYIVIASILLEYHCKLPQP